VSSEIKAVRSVAWALGWLRIAASDHGICRVALQAEEAAWEGESPVANTFADEARRQLSEYLCGNRREFTVPLDISAGSAFQQTVWLATTGVSFGEHVPYSTIAAEVCAPQACRAVGQALKRNPMLILIPCHRVVRLRGGLGGFRAGEEAKLWLLRHEGIILL